MRFAEPLAVLRRIPVYLVDGTGDPVTGAAPVGSELRVSKSGAGWSNAGGSWSEVGFGAYTYEATLTEATTASFLLLRVLVGAARPYVYVVDIGDRIVSDAVSAARRVPIYLVDADGEAVPGLTPTVQVSLAGAAWTTGAGSVTATDDGAYVYELAAAELVEGPGVLRVADAAAQVYVYTWDVRPAGIALAAALEPVVASSEFGTQIATIDHITAALARLPHQYRGTDG